MTDIPSYIDWHVGMKIVCIETWFEPNDGYGDEIGPVEGKIYTIREIGCLFPSSPGTVHVRLCEVVNNARPYNGLGIWEQAFRATRFRPVQTRKTDISIFNRILLNPRIRISEDA